MSVANQILAASETALLAGGHADKFKVISGVSIGFEFEGRLDVEPAIDPQNPLGLDYRMNSILRCKLDSDPELGQGDQVSWAKGKLKMLKKADFNASSITVDYLVEQLQ